MGKLINAKNYSKKNNLTSFRKGNYSNYNAVGNTINYITRNTDKLEERKSELLAWGGYGVLFLSPESAIRCFRVLQENENINRRGGQRVIHEFFSMVNDEGIDEGAYIVSRLGTGAMVQLAYECARLYYNEGFQVVFAIHYDPGKKYHIHFVVNAISFINGLKFKETLQHMGTIENAMNEIIQRYANMANTIKIAI